MTCMPDRSRKGRSDAAPRPAPAKEVSDAQAETVRVHPGEENLHMSELLATVAATETMHPKRGGR